MCVCVCVAAVCRCAVGVRCSCHAVTVRRWRHTSAARVCLVALCCCHPSPGPAGLPWPPPGVAPGGTSRGLHLPQAVPRHACTCCRLSSPMCGGCGGVAGEESRGAGQPRQPAAASPARCSKGPAAQCGRRRRERCHQPLHKEVQPCPPQAQTWHCGVCGRLAALPPIAPTKASTPALSTPAHCPGPLLQHAAKRYFWPD